MKEQYTKHKLLIPGLTWEDFASSLVQILSSSKSDDELQNELIEMLGFDLFEFIAEILSKRQLILEAFRNEKTGSRSQSGRYFKDVSKQILLFSISSQHKWSC